MDSNTDEEDFTSFDEQPSATGSYLHHNDYGPDHVCDVYHNEHVTYMGFDPNTANNSCHFSPQHMIKNQDYEALHPSCSGYLLIVLNIPSLLQPSGFETHIAFHFANILSHVSLLPVSLIVMSLSPLTLCSALGSNTTAVQIFVGHNSKYINFYGVATDHDISCTLEENIVSHGAMDVLICDHSCTPTSQKVKDILHMYCIKSCTGEPHHQHQNYSE